MKRGRLTMTHKYEVDLVGSFTIEETFEVEAQSVDSARSIARGLFEASIYDNAYDIGDYKLRPDLGIQVKEVKLVDDKYTIYVFLERFISDEIWDRKHYAKHGDIDGQVGQVIFESKEEMEGVLSFLNSKASLKSEYAHSIFKDEPFLPAEEVSEDFKESLIGMIVRSYGLELGGYR